MRNGYIKFFYLFLLHKWKAIFINDMYFSLVLIVNYHLLSFWKSIEPIIKFEFIDIENFWEKNYRKRTLNYIIEYRYLLLLKFHHFKNLLIFEVVMIDYLMIMNKILLFVVRSMDLFVVLSSSLLIKTI